MRDVRRVAACEHPPENLMNFKKNSSERNLHENCSQHFCWLDLIDCGETMASSDISNIPDSDETWMALSNLARCVLDPVVDKFGRIQLTYCFSSPRLSSRIKRSIAPRRDQHASHEKLANGNPVCGLGGAAADFFAIDFPSTETASFIVEHLPFDALYFYGSSRPAHVSWSRSPRKLVVEMKFNAAHQRHFPVRRAPEKFLELYGK